MKRRAYIGLGSNLGNRHKNFAQALDLIDKTNGIELKRVSSVYETKPIGVEGTAWFLNSVVEALTKLEPLELLDELENIECKLGRSDKGEKLPRVIDCDILWLDGIILRSKRLTVPHPHLWDRAFCLMPLAELAPDLKLDGRGLVTTRARKLADTQQITRVNVSDKLI